ncbi:MAG: acetyl-CoA synthetase [Candidimonas sp.]|nr:MAG: acetyl-CoA synthetase [Candidimonas sp.]TAM21688.1 MAG: acetyl-CoA synthetase [Candidimonas sp.]TAM77638.1 MAG: acetyl-CoA synthetase [Candidimonas sp.]
MNDQYPELYSSYHWFVPSQFNIAQACVHRWAENPHEGRRIAIYFENEAGQREVWTYARLAENANQLANGLTRMGVARGDRVAVVMAQRPETAAAYMAIFSVGAIAAPMPAELGVDGLSKRLRDAEARVAIVDGAGGPDLIQAQMRCPALTQIIGLGFQHDNIIPWRTLLARQPSSFKAIPTQSSAPALLLYTCEPSHNPKGALLSHSALIGNLPGFVASQNWFPQKSDQFWSPAEWTQASGLMGALLPTLYFGHSIVAALGRFSATRAFELLERYQITNTFLSAANIKAMMDEVSNPRDQYQLALRAIASTGASPDQAATSWCVNALGVTPNEMFGQTEMNALIGHSAQKWPVKIGSMGRPYPGHRVAVLDAHGKRCAAGQEGEIALNRYDMHGHLDPVLFLGYWHNDLATRAKFVDDWCLSGEQASIDDEGYFWRANASATEHVNP